MSDHTHRILFHHIKELLDEKQFYVVTDRYPPGNPINYGKCYVEVYAYKHVDGPNPKPRSIFSSGPIYNIRMRIFALSVSVETWLDRPSPESWLTHTQMTGMVGYMLRDQQELDLIDPQMLDRIKNIIVRSGEPV